MKKPRKPTKREQEFIDRICEYQERDARRSDRLGLIILSPAIIGCVIMTGFVAREIVRDTFKALSGGNNERD